MNEFNKYLTSLKVIILASILTLGISFVSAQWQDPTLPPFGGNVERPINVGALSQTKSGSLWAGFLGSEGAGFINGNFEIGGQVTIKGGNPATGRYLRATNSAGLAEWAKPNLVCVKRQQTVTAIGGAPVTNVSVACQSNEIRTGGGGSCSGGPVTHSAPGSTDFAWDVKCDNSDTDSVPVSSYAICCSIQ